MLNLQILTSENLQEPEVTVSLEELFFMDNELAEKEDSFNKEMAKTMELRAAVETLIDVYAHIEKFGITAEFQALLEDQLCDVAPSFTRGEQEDTLRELGVSIEGFLASLKMAMKSVLVKWKMLGKQTFTTVSTLEKQIEKLMSQLESKPFTGDEEALLKAKVIGFDRKVIPATLPKLMEMLEAPAALPEWNPDSKFPVKDEREKQEAIANGFKLDSNPLCAIGFNNAKTRYKVKGIMSLDKQTIAACGFSSSKDILAGVAEYKTQFDLDMWFKKNSEHEHLLERVIEDMGGGGTTTTVKTTSTSEDGETIKQVSEIILKNGGLDKVCDIAMEMYISFYRAGYHIYNQILLMYYNALLFMK